MKIIESDRVYLRHILKEDVNKQYLGWMKDPDVTLYLQSQVLGIADLQEYVDGCINSEKVLMFAVVAKDSDIHIGNVKLDLDDRNKRATFGIMIGNKAYWNKGYGTETTKLTLEYCINILHYRRINLTVNSHNKSAIKIYKKLGFIEEGIFRKALLFRGNFVDEYFMTYKNYE